MRLLPVSETSWRAIKAQWKKEAEGSGEDFSTYSVGTFAALDPIAAEDPHKAGLFALFEDDRAHAFCQVNRLLMSRYTSPVLRARFVTVSPLYDAGTAEAGGYARVLVALFSGVVWLSRDNLAAQHIRFLMRSPSDSQFFAALQISTPLSPFSKFRIQGSWAECTMKAAPVAQPA